MPSATIISSDNISFSLSKIHDCSLIHDFADYNVDIPIPYHSHLISLFLTFRSIFNKRKHKLPLRFQQLTDDQQQSLIDISNFLGHSKLTDYITHLYYSNIYFKQLIPKFFTDM